MRTRFLFLLLVPFLLWPRAASADPLHITNGLFALDIEGDFFTFEGAGFRLSTTEVLIYSTKVFPSQCFFCAEGQPVDWSFETTPGEQLLGRGTVALGAVDATNVDFVGSMRFNAVPTPLSSGGTTDFEFVAPFSFEAAIRGLAAGDELFARHFMGSGTVRVDYEASTTPGVFVSDDDTILYEFSPTPVPEPGTLLLLGSGLAAAALRRRRSA